MESTANIVLNFTVEKNTERRIELGWHDSTRVIHVDLKAYEKAYASGGDSGEFEVFLD